ncbi:PadR family transcriptional regulator [Micromonospora sp. KC207]|uniref:PadR family transcriptional regulator n=1 Tax=Micromonospora sp. KC207 TaxID=2530377 RepID=UPI001FB5F2D0|nr:PadR family transcriptional regulator [Micromonospora sp. KC207]
MTVVFSHGRLRLYLLKLLDDGPKHGYELIRLLEDRFLGLYAPSAGTIYPRLQRLEAEGRVTHTAAGGRKIYEITEAGQAELRQRAGELATLESDISSSVADLSTLANEIRSEVRGSVRDLKRELREATRRTQQSRRTRWETPPAPGPARPDAPTDASPLLAELDQRLAAFTVEIGALVRAGRLDDVQLRAAIRVLDGALDGLRRLLRQATTASAPLLPSSQGVSSNRPAQAQ